MGDFVRRKKRTVKIRSKIRKLKSFRVSVHKTARHIYVQLFSVDCSRVLSSASSLDKTIRENVNLKNKTGVEIAFAVGELFATRLKGVVYGKLSFDRAGFKYHGRVKAVVDGMAKNGVLF